MREYQVKQKFIQRLEKRLKLQNFIITILKYNNTVCMILYAHVDTVMVTDSVYCAGHFYEARLQQVLVIYLLRHFILYIWLVLLNNCSVRVALYQLMSISTQF